MRLEKLAFSELIFFECFDESREEMFLGIKRHAKNHLEKLGTSIKENGWGFPLIVAELPNGDKYLIDGYARWRLEEKEKESYGFSVDFIVIKHDAVVIQAKDLNHAKELYLQWQSQHGTANWADFKSLNSGTSESRYEIPGMVHPNFDLSVMTREDLAQALLETKYQIL